MNTLFLPEGAEILFLAQSPHREVFFIAKDEGRMRKLAELWPFFAPDWEVLVFPAYDSLPYDRVSPKHDVVGERIDCIMRTLTPPKGKRVVLTTPYAALQRLPYPDFFARQCLAIKEGLEISQLRLCEFLEHNGYNRAETVLEPGEYTQRGGIIDIFPPGLADPLRIDFFGDEIESLRYFDPLSQRSLNKISEITLFASSEIILNEKSIALFRKNYREQFGNPNSDDPLYAAISEGRKFPGMENFLPLFYERTASIFEYNSRGIVIIDQEAEAACDTQIEQINDFYAARLAHKGKEGNFNPLLPQFLYLNREEWDKNLATRNILRISQFGGENSLNSRIGPDFAPTRARGENVFEALKEYIQSLNSQKITPIIACYSEGSRERMNSLLKEHHISGPELVILGLEKGFSAGSKAYISEQDILGERITRKAKKRKNSLAFINGVAPFQEGDLLVHSNHGIGRYEGLETVTAAGAPHDCLKLSYLGGDRLFVPVENIDTLSRYGSETTGVELDKLGSSAWQNRKAKLKKRIRDMAEQLITIAAARKLRQGQVIPKPEGLYEEFCARFPYAETEDQLKAIAEAIEDLASGQPMDRLVCGDVGFGKTEVALRAAFVAAMSGFQVAVITPTTLLCRQHFLTFSQRFQGFPIRIAQLSRLVAGKKSALTKEEISQGKVDIVIGTHALLSENIKFKDLGLLIVDEEQHFGVAHKEKLKKLKSGVHVLTLTATPIPRTLQMALTGLRELSLITTPPVDRLAIKSFVMPFDDVIIRDALLRERHRGGQSFYVCPRIADIERERERLTALVPELKLAVAHGQMPATQIEEIMTAFADGAYDILMATNIIESGLDLPAVNTIVIQKADLFGLSQLYQLRGRVGRGKLRAYAYLITPAARLLSKAAEKRLQVMQTLDALGAGFTLASHDLDIRGAGNLLGDEQSGHIKEVGIELYQQLLEEAIKAAKGGDKDAAEEWSPQINLGMAVLIPESYVPGLSSRLSLYRRLSELQDSGEIADLREELIDRFGELPLEVENLLAVVGIKVLCRKANVEKIDAGVKGAVISFKDNRFGNPAGLVGFINQQKGAAKLRPDHKLVVNANWETPALRLKGCNKLVGELARLNA